MTTKPHPDSVTLLIIVWLSVTVILGALTAIWWAFA